MYTFSGVFKEEIALVGKRQRSWVVLATYLFVGLIVGGIIGELTAQAVPITGREFAVGINPPFTLDLHLVTITLGFGVRINLLGAVGLLVGLLLYTRS